MVISPFGSIFFFKVGRRTCPCLIIFGSEKPSSNASNPISRCRMACRLLTIGALSAETIHVIRNGLRWRDAPEVYGPHKTLYNRFVRWSRMGVFARIFSNLFADDEPPDCLMIDSTHSKPTGLPPVYKKGGMFPGVSAARKVG